MHRQKSWICGTASGAQHRAGRASSCGLGPEYLTCRLALAMNSNERFSHFGGFVLSGKPEVEAHNTKIHPECGCNLYTNFRFR
ncbi:hypothetical protein NGR_c05780 [Sinorhizobium fredii NGR234]|uniref:Uncharacterized protein n=1 Tax=Sinorhizobium fredii (strain NBRC 101917 / NGR234) TaxID=394 RepID=C3MHP3_SINFN|nr:hypothetical protein NGR_c05780 [Sinorhizobium fredii NGR234]